MRRLSFVQTEYFGSMDRSLYLALRSTVKSVLDQQLYAGHGVSISPGRFTHGIDFNGQMTRIIEKDVLSVWPQIMVDLGLEDDRTKTHTLTMSRDEVTVVEEIKAAIKGVVI